MSALGTVDDALARVIDEALERRLRPLVAELAELRAALQARGSTNAPTEYLTSTEAARLLKLSSQTLHRWVKVGKLEAEGPPVGGHLIPRNSGPAGGTGSGKSRWRTCCR
jgi:excisionase family DNA binding protein